MMLKCLCVYLFVCVWNWTIWNILNNNPIQNESLSIILNWNEFIRWKDSELPMDAQESNRIAPDRLAIDFLLGIVAHWRLKILLYAHALQFHQYYYLSHFDIASTDFLRIDCIVGCQTIGTKFTFSNVVSHSKLLHRSHFLIFVNFVLFSTSLLALFSYCFFFLFLSLSICAPMWMCELNYRKMNLVFIRRVSHIYWMYSMRFNQRALPRAVIVLGLVLGIIHTICAILLLLFICEALNKSGPMAIIALVIR